MAKSGGVPRQGSVTLLVPSPAGTADLMNFVALLLRVQGGKVVLLPASIQHGMRIGVYCTCVYIFAHTLGAHAHLHFSSSFMEMKFHLTFFYFISCM